MSLLRIVLNRPRTVIALWLAVVVVASPFALRLAGALRGSTDAVAGSPSELVWRDLDRAFGTGTGFVFPLVVSSSSVHVDQPQFGASVALLQRKLESSGMKSVRHYWNTGDSTMLGRDGRSVLLLVTPPAATFFDAESMVGRIRTTVADAQLQPTFAVDLTGMIAVFHDLDVSASDDLLRAERVGIPLTLLVLTIVFGAPIAAMLPLLLAMGATVVTLAMLFALSRTMPVSVFAQNAVTMVGLGIGVDEGIVRSDPTEISRADEFFQDSRDPIAGSIRDPQTLNRYIYGRNLPVSMSSFERRIPM